MCIRDSTEFRHLLLQRRRRGCRNCRADGGAVVLTLLAHPAAYLRSPAAADPLRESLAFHADEPCRRSGGRGRWRVHRAREVEDRTALYAGARRDGSKQSLIKI